MCHKQALYAERQYAECRAEYARCRFFNVMLNVIMLSVVMVRCRGAGLLNIRGRICNNGEHNFQKEIA